MFLSLVCLFIAFLEKYISRNYWVSFGVRFIPMKNSECNEHGTEEGGLNCVG